MSPKNNRGQYVRNLSYAAGAGSSGCLTVIIIMALMFFGIWLDGQLGTRPAFTLILVLSAIPLSLAAMFYSAISATRRIVPPQVTTETESIDDEDD